MSLRPGQGVAAIALGVVSLAILSGYLGALWPPLEALSHVRLHLAAIATALAVVGAAQGRRSLALAALLCAAAGVIGLGPALGGAAREAGVGGGVPVTLAVANVFRDNVAPQDAARAIAALDADIVVLVEAGPGYLTENATLRRSHPWMAVRAGFPDEPQVAVLSRFPILEDRSRPPQPYLPARISTRIDLGAGAALDVAGLHLGRPMNGYRRDDLAALPGVAARWRPPLVVAGDFNATPWSATVSAVARITGTRIVGGLRPTWLPAAAPDWLRRIAGLPIDHILASPEIGVDWARGFAIPGSDHRGVLVRLRVPRQVSQRRRRPPPRPRCRSRRAPAARPAPARCARRG